MMLFIEFKGSIHEVQVTQEGMLIGRSSKALPIQDARCSKKHAVLFETADGRLCILDLTSANGTFLNGKEISCAEVKAGSKIQVGDSVLTLLSVDSERTQFNLVERGWPGAWNCVPRR